MQQIRLDKIIADSGIASRREAAQLIKNGFVTINGRTASSGADKYNPDAVEITLSGKRLVFKRQHYIMMNKPAGYVTATQDRVEKTVNELLKGVYGCLGLFAAGRLDKDAEGLLLLTDDGDYAHRIISPSKKVYKTYFVETDGVLDSEDTIVFYNGIVLKDGLKCLPAQLDILTSGIKSTAYVKIREGKYHQVKRMLAARGKPVSYLKRVSIGGLKLDERLAAGEYRELTVEEALSVFDSDVEI